MRAINRIRLFFREMENQKEARIEVGEDKFGNKYYQYYSFVGLPSRRECQYIDRSTFHIHRDLGFYKWMYRHQELPPTKEDLKL